MRWIPATRLADYREHLEESGQLAPPLELNQIQGSLELDFWVTGQNEL